MTEWQPIETAPKDGTEIFVYAKWKYKNCDAKYSWRVANYRSDISGWENGCHFWTITSTHFHETAIEPTHWMPLPPPPEEAI